MEKVLSFEQEWIRQYPDRIAILRHMREAIGVKEVRWDDVTNVNLAEVARLIKRKCSGGTPQTYFAIIKSFLRTYGEYIPHEIFPKTELKAKSAPSQNVFLTEEEISRIEAYAERLEKKNGRQTEKDTVNAFLVECFCGARGIDVASFTEQNIIDGYLVYISKKTGVLSKVPIHPKIADRLLRKPSKRHDPSLMNRIIKRVAKEVGITEEVTIMYRGKMRTMPKYKFLGFHTARRSFCSNLANRDVDIYTIASLAGHKSANMTFRYIVTDSVRLPSEAVSFFSGQ